MKKFGSILEMISCKVVCAIAVVLLILFTYWAGLYTHMTSVDLENLKVRLYEDSIVLNIFWLLITLSVFFWVSKIVLTTNEKTNKQRIRIIAYAVVVAAGILSVVWVLLHNYEPDHDQLQVVRDAMDFLSGDYSDLKGYLEIYPHQIGLVFLYEILFFIWADYEIISFIHVIWIMVIIYFAYATAEELFGNCKVSLYTIIGTALFVPMYFYLNYAYGDLSMAACGILGIWCLVKYCKSIHKKYAVALVGVMTLGYLARANTMIVIIGMLLVLLVHGISKLNGRILLVAAALLVIPASVQKGIVTYYENKADVQMASGSPAILHVAMGMQDTYEGPGYYNAYNLTTYVNLDKDAAAAAEVAKEYILCRIQEMKNDISYTKNFYLVKIWQQWNEPSFSGELSTRYFSEEPGEFVQSVYYGSGQQFLRNFRNRYLYILYAGAFVCALFKLIFGKKEEKIWEYLIFVIFIGGFLFSLLWENKSRYVMSYIVMLLPYSAYGLWQLQRVIIGGFQLIKSKMNERRI